MISTKKLLFALALFMALPMMAQDENALKNVNVGELSYTVKT